MQEGLFKLKVAPSTAFPFSKIIYVSVENLYPLPLKSTIVAISFTKKIKPYEIKQNVYKRATFVIVIILFNNEG